MIGYKLFKKGKFTRLKIYYVKFYQFLEQKFFFI